jgi:hypothetical protein
MVEKSKIALCSCGAPAEECWKAGYYDECNGYHEDDFEDDNWDAIDGWTDFCTNCEHKPPEDYEPPEDQ